MVDSKISDISYYLPSKKTILNKSNKYFKRVYEKTGILSTYMAKEKEDVIDLAVRAYQKIKNKKNIDAIIFVTQTPRYLLPSCSCIIQDKLGLNKGIFTMDINMGCSGFLHGLCVSDALISKGIAKKILLICSDTYSKYMNKQNNNKFIFSDAASAIIIEKSKKKKINNFMFGTDGSKHESIIIKHDSNKKQFYMNGPAVYGFTTNTIPKLIEKFNKKYNKNIASYKKIFLHQASKIVLETIVQKFPKKYKEKFYIGLKNIGNTTSSSIPISIKKCLIKKDIKHGDKILICGFGVGLSWGIANLTI